MTHPPLPKEFQQSTKFNLNEIWAAVCQELADTDFQSRSHHNRRTYDAGCYGPLCRKAVRDHSRKRTGSSPRDEFRELDPILMYFFSEAQRRIREHMEDLLNSI